jgi:hypothetical protein
MKYKTTKTPYLAFAPDLSEMLPYVVIEDEFPFMAVFYTPHQTVAEELASRLNESPLPALDFVGAIKEMLNERGFGTTLEDLQKMNNNE